MRALAGEMPASQLREYSAKGLIEEPGADGRWPASELQRLLVAKAMAADVHSIARRVLRMRGDPYGYPVAGAKLQAAMVAVVPTIHKPIRKAGRIAAYAIPWPWPSIRSRVLGEIRFGVVKRRVIPPFGRWDEILRSTDPARFDQLAERWYAIVQRVMPTGFPAGTDPLADIPLEEQITIYAVLDLAFHAPWAFQ